MALDICTAKQRPCSTSRVRGSLRRDAVPFAAAAMALTIYTAPTQAQTPSPLGEWQYSAGVPLQKLYMSSIPEWEARIGIGSTFEPRYEGENRYRTLVGPSVDMRYRDLAFLSTGEGIGVNVLRGPNWRVSVAAAYDLGRRAHDDASRLAGLDNINPAPEMKIAAEYVVSKAFPLVVRGVATRSFGGSNGWTFDLGTYMPLPGSSEKFYWFAGPSVTFADSKYMNSWFGVTADQALRSGYRRYDASAGLKSAGFGVTMVYFVNKHWFVSADGAFKRLLGSAADSPITRTRLNGVCDVSINYQF
ncbi:MipA/OmpV family protein [Mycetohabitans sp. B5]|uniref:Outer membrane scaffolding protein for murein synthesis (MipA/OmpV family) n=2 Tax=Burkholderiaceae TaxID=119060 RepID=A0A2P5KBU7_9BURK|nr:MipA/OmpV family protein [Mycetohabitans sp. B5]PPB84183.1 outer membrane scaffolding protein for murein synthesis (MipA/OmpV family) [Mycetohabitans endofungorum]